MSDGNSKLRTSFAAAAAGTVFGGFIVGAVALTGVAAAAGPAGIIAGVAIGACMGTVGGKAAAKVYGAIKHG